MVAAGVMRLVSGVRRHRHWCPYIPSSVWGTQCVPVVIKAFCNCVSVFCVIVLVMMNQENFKKNTIPLGGRKKIFLNSARICVVCLWLRLVSLFGNKVESASLVPEECLRCSL